MEWLRNLRQRAKSRRAGVLAGDKAELPGSSGQSAFVKESDGKPRASLTARQLGRKYHVRYPARVSSYRGGSNPTYEGIFARAALESLAVDEAVREETTKEWPEKEDAGVQIVEGVWESPTPNSTIAPIQEHATPSIVSDYNGVHGAEKNTQGISASGETFHYSFVGNRACYSTLPPELKILIWTFTLTPRVIPIKHGHINDKAFHAERVIAGKHICYADIQIPSALHTCRLSREVALQTYRSTFSARLKHPIYFDSNNDIIAITDEKVLVSFTYVVFGPTTTTEMENEGLQFLAVDLQPHHIQRSRRQSERAAHHYAMDLVYWAQNRSVPALTASFDHLRCLIILDRMDASEWRGIAAAVSKLRDKGRLPRPSETISRPEFIDLIYDGKKGVGGFEKVLLNAIQ